MMDACIPLHPGERIDDLQRGGLRIIQREAGFRFGTDAVLLADFAMAKRGERVCDMGTGTGVLPLLIAARAEDTQIDAFEVQADVADMAARNVRLNGLESRIRVHHADCREAARVIGHEVCSLVVTNPPYTAAGAGLVSPDGGRAKARACGGAQGRAARAACRPAARHAPRGRQLHRRDAAHLRRDGLITAIGCDGFRRGRGSPAAARAGRRRGRASSRCSGRGAAAGTRRADSAAA